MESQNSKRFIETYNRLDQVLRSIFNLKPSVNYSDAVRRAATMSSVVRKYEDILIDYGRLRNAIVHKSSDLPIAEPHDDVVSKFEQIERIISTPPLAINSVSGRGVDTADGKMPVKTLIEDIYKTGYSNIPVYLEGMLIGVVNRKMIIDSIGRILLNNQNVEEFLKQPIVDALQVYAITSHYEVVSEKTTIDQILFMFQQNRKLSTVIITKNGDYKSEPLGIVVTADVIDMQTVLDNY